MLLPEPGKPISATTIGTSFVFFASASNANLPQPPCASYDDTTPRPPSCMRPLYVKRYLITGLLTIVPLWLTWVVFKFVFTMLSHIGAPVVAGIAVALGAAFPAASS